MRSSETGVSCNTHRWIKVGKEKTHQSKTGIMSHAVMFFEVDKWVSMSQVVGRFKT